MTVFTPRPYQQVGLSFIKQRPFCALYLPMGYGKTVVTLSALMEIAPPGNILIIGPTKIIANTWPDEIEKWGIPAPYDFLAINPKTRKRWAKVSKRHEKYQESLDISKPKIWLINREMLADLVEWMPYLKNEKGHYIRDAEGKKIKRWPFQTVVVDEAQGFKNPKANCTKALASVRPYITRMILLTGTPTPNGERDLWAPIWLLDRGLALKPTFDEFDSTYFNVVKSNNYGVPIKWELKPGAKEYIYSRINHLVMSSANIPADMPDVLPPKNIIVDLDSKQQAAYDKFKKELVLSLDDGSGDIQKIIADNAAILRAKLLQYASGTLYVPQTTCSVCGEDVTTKTVLKPMPVPVHDDETDINHDINVDTEMLDAVIGKIPAAVRAAPRSEESVAVMQAMRDEGALSLPCTTCKAPAHIEMRDRPDSVYTHIDTTIVDHQARLISKQASYTVIHKHKMNELNEILTNVDSPVLIAHRFVAERLEMVRALSKQGHEMTIFDGTPKMMDDWNARRIKNMIIHPASAGHGLNLQFGGQTLVWYSLPDSSEHYEQTNGRLVRPGQKNTVSILRLITRNTFDERQPQMLRRKYLSQAELIDAMNKEYSNIDL